MRIFLLPLSWLYGLAVAARNLGFRLALLRQQSVGVPVISVGNLTAGGTGKTPLVEFIVEILLRHGRKPAVVSRGYGRRTRGVVIVSHEGRMLVDACDGGDEPVQIARKMPAASVVVGERRVDAALAAVNTCGADVIVLDDGFQHRYLARDLDIVVLDARRDIRREPLLPAGTRREWVSGLKRASMLAFSRSDNDAPPAWAKDLETSLSGRMIAYRYRMTGFAGLADGRPMEIGSPAYAFSGIGDHEGFIRVLRTAGVAVAGEERFGDHHMYTSSDIEGILGNARDRGARMIVTTEKDMNRLAGDGAAMNRLASFPAAAYAIIRVEIAYGGELLEQMIDGCLKGRTQRW